jgi:hypothetical protein
MSSIQKFLTELQTLVLDAVSNGTKLEKVFKKRDFIDEVTEMVETLIKQASKKLKDPNEPKKPKKAFALYREQLSKRIKEENPQAKASDIMKMVSSEWKELDEEKRQPYIVEEVEDKKRYESEMKEYVRPDDDELRKLAINNKRPRAKRDPNAPKKEKKPVNDDWKNITVTVNTKGYIANAKERLKIKESLAEQYGLKKSADIDKKYQEYIDEKPVKSPKKKSQPQSDSEDDEPISKRSKSLKKKSQPQPKKESSKSPSLEEIIDELNKIIKSQMQEINNTNDDIIRNMTDDQVDRFINDNREKIKKIAKVMIKYDKDGDYPWGQWEQYFYLEFLEDADILDLANEFMRVENKKSKKESKKDVEKTKKASKNDW